jgi:putative two-component system response regulator
MDSEWLQPLNDNEGMKMTQAATILAVDDELMNRELIAAILGKEGYSVLYAENGEEALAVLGSRVVDVILMDVMMPVMDGFEAVRRIKANESLKNIPIIMLTALSDKNSLKESLRLGANEFLSKPFELDELKIRIKNMVVVKRYQDSLEDMVAARTKELESALLKLKDSERDVIATLVKASEFKDTDTSEHIERMSLYSLFIAKKLGLSEEDQELILSASPMHDVGKIGIPDSILLKPAKLSSEEFEVMKSHSNIGFEILSVRENDILKAGREIALSHHEKWDGSGYPNGLAGEQIPLFGRISAIADVFDALGTRRPYKEPFSNDECFRIIAEGRGTHFDPAIVDLFLKHKEEILQIKAGFDKV